MNKINALNDDFILEFLLKDNLKKFKIFAFCRKLHSLQLFA